MKKSQIKTILKRLNRFEWINLVFIIISFLFLLFTNNYIFFILELDFVELFIVSSVMHKYLEYELK